MACYPQKKREKDLKVTSVQGRGVHLGPLDIRHQEADQRPGIFSPEKTFDTKGPRGPPPPETLTQEVSGEMGTHGFKCPGGSCQLLAALPMEAEGLTYLRGQM